MKTVILFEQVCSPIDVLYEQGYLCSVVYKTNKKIFFKSTEVTQMHK